MSIMEKFKLNGKIALVTGCSKGIGFGIAKGLAEAGADIIGVSSTLHKGSEIEITLNRSEENSIALTVIFQKERIRIAF